MLIFVARSINCIELTQSEGTACSAAYQSLIKQHFYFISAMYLI